ncbi:Vps51/Vps67-like protein [Stemphylium lycopersici]|uniref:Vacuolar protein sorting-associated protein 51 homolog n=1 Tax=Stemphylium lycopersici TaxID=183478 RepID=A0A364N658_STELY|nr:Vps51/Vps67-like protein [Stemphylium lycopersici]RAR12814.1 Vps51/Vps67-like protein [Stemphylium lycopersici]
MSTIASPRASSSIRSPSLTRTSIDSSSSHRPAQQPARRNRAALREFYGIKTAPRDATPDARISEETTKNQLGPEEDETLTELDASNFNAKAFVEGLLAREGLQGVLKVEADLVSQIRNLDSDRKSLVYDNYSKLLSATSTIRRMRGNMDPLAPTTHTLGPAISHIAETAASLSSSLQDSHQSKEEGLGISIRVEQDEPDKAEAEKKRKQKETVRWVLDTPTRLQVMVGQERKEEAEKEWDEVRRILDKWKGVAGVQELREQCEAIMQEEKDESE